MLRSIVTTVLLSLIGTAAVVGSYVYLQPVPCASPITYKIGTIDSRFGVSLDTFKKDIVQASGIWEKAVGKTLFGYDPKGVLTINLVYDNRQAITQKENTLNASITETTQTAESVKQQYTALKAQYANAEDAYQAQLSEFTTAQASYNAEVAHWNSIGGAPKKQYDALTAEKNSLVQQQKALEQQRVQVNQLADTVNAFIHKYNLLVSYINSNISAIRNDGLSGTQFEEGVYISDRDGQRINIYQFGNKVDLIRVLAHELGHSLGLDHNAGKDSIMNPVNTSDALTASPDDLADLKVLCNIR